MYIQTPDDAQEFAADWTQRATPRRAARALRQAAEGQRSRESSFRAAGHDQSADVAAACAAVLETHAAHVEGANERWERLTGDADTHGAERDEA